MSRSVDNGELINFLYRSVDERGALEEFGSLFSATYQTPYGIMSVRNKADFQLLDVFAWGFDDGNLKAYTDYYYQHDVLTFGLLTLKPSEFHPHEAAYCDKAFLKSEIYHDYAAPLALRHAAGAVLPIPYSTTCFHFGACRQRNQVRYKQEDVAQLNQLVPHLQQFLFLRERFGQMETRLAGLEQAFSRLGVAAFVCDQDGKIRHQTEEGDSLLRRHKGLGAKQGVLRCGSGKTFEAFRRLVADATAASGGEDRSPGGVLRVEGEEGDLDVVVTPIRYAAPGSLFGHSQPSAAVFIRPARSRSPLTVAALSGLYDLTAAEAAVAVFLTQGQSLAQIATTRGVSIETVRKQLKTLFLKTDTHSQSDLVSMLAVSLAALSEADTTP